MTHFPLCFTNCGFRKTGLLGSFQAIHFETRPMIWPSGPLYVPEYRRAAAVTNAFMSAMLFGAVFQPAGFAHVGVPMTVKIGCIP